MLADLARRDGRRVVAFDLFGDLDLRRSASRVVTPSELGGGGLSALVGAAATEPASGVVYGASFENHPALVARLAERHALLGNAPETLRAVRDPARLGAALRDAGLPYPRTFVTAPRRAHPAAGCASRCAAAAARACATGAAVRCRPGAFVQERIDGLACSAAAVGDGVGCRRARADRAARGAARVRGPRLPLVREPRPAAPAGRRAGGAAASGARDLLLPGGRVRVAGAVRRRLHLGRSSARGRSRSTRAPPPRSRRSRRRTGSRCSTRTCAAAPASCRASRPRGRAPPAKPSSSPPRT